MTTMSSRLSFTDATPELFPQIVALEEEAAGASLVTLTAGHALHEAHERGHSMLVAIDDDHVVGWIWFSVELGRGGEYVGRIVRLAVRAAHVESGVGRGLVERAHASLAEQGCASVRVTLDAADGETRAVLESAGYAIDSMTMGRRL